MTSSNSPVCVIAGAGDLGSHLGRLRVAQGDTVLSLRRRAHEAGGGARALAVDLATGRGIEQLSRQVESLVFCAAPDERSELAYRALYRDGLRRLLDHLECPRWLFVSSTAVYGEDVGEWVDESTPERPPAFTGAVLLEAERELAAHPGGSVLRCSGLYGPGREAMLRRARDGQPGRRHWTNRIHVEDAAAALSLLLESGNNERVYIGSDDAPTLEAEVLDWLRQREGWPACGALAGAESGRRLRNARLRALGWRPRFPDFRAGYASLTPDQV